MFLSNATNFSWACSVHASSWIYRPWSLYKQWCRDRAVELLPPWVRIHPTQVKKKKIMFCLFIVFFKFSKINYRYCVWQMFVKAPCQWAHHVKTTWFSGGTGGPPVYHMKTMSWSNILPFMITGQSGACTRYYSVGIILAFVIWSQICWYRYYSGLCDMSIQADILFWPFWYVHSGWYLGIILAWE